MKQQIQPAFLSRVTHLIFFVTQRVYPFGKNDVHIRSRDVNVDKQKKPSTNQINDNTWFSETFLLLALAGLPLVDSYFLLFLTTDKMAGISGAILFGLTVFSGAGCVTAAMQLKGGWMRRIAQILGVYAIVAVGAFVEYKTLPLTSYWIDNTWKIISGVFLIGLGLKITGADRLKNLSQWMRVDSIPKILGFVILYHVIDLCIDFLSGTVQLPAHQVTYHYMNDVLIALGIGFLFTVSGMVVALFVPKSGVDKKALNLYFGMAIVLMGLLVMDIPIYKNLPLIVIVFGLEQGYGRLVRDFVLKIFNHKS